MIKNEIKAAVEAMLFACGSPVDAEKLCEILEITSDELEETTEAIRTECECGDRGITLIKLDGAFQLCTKPVMAPFVKRALQLRRTPPLSRAALEVLAIVAYNQPVTRLFIEQVRGVDSSYIVSGLCDKALIAERGTLDAPGRPTLFGTTDNFLRCFGLQSLDDLPSVDFSAGTDDDGQQTLDVQGDNPAEGD